MILVRYGIAIVLLISTMFALQDTVKVKRKDSKKADPWNSKMNNIIFSIRKTKVLKSQKNFKDEVEQENIPF